MEIELYLHIPFCVRKCAYCDFLSGPATEEAIEQYVQALTREIESYREMAAERSVSTIFMGGGTPSVLTDEQLERIFTSLRNTFSILRTAEISIEMNPGTIRKEFLESCKKAGVNRVSLGLQSSDNSDLRRLGRIHTWEEFLDNYELVRKTGFTNVNVDLMSAIPGQTPESWERVLRNVAELAPEHLSAYSLIIEEGTPFFDKYGDEEGRKLLPDEEADREMYELTKRVLAEYGYERYEVSNYAKKGYECRHNLGYWERNDYLGIGLGASSLVDNIRFSHETDLALYMKKMSDSHEKSDGRGILKSISQNIEELSVSEQIEETMFLGLRKTEGISKKEFLENFGISLENVYGKQLEQLEKIGFLKEEKGRISLTETGIDVSNEIFVEFMEPEI